MSFEQAFPTVARLLGKRNVTALNQHASDLFGTPDDDAVAHFKTCALADWCSLNTTKGWSVSRVVRAVSNLHGVRLATVVNQIRVRWL